PTAPPPLSLHDALPISAASAAIVAVHPADRLRRDPHVVMNSMQSSLWTTGNEHAMCHALNEDRTVFAVSACGIRQSLSGAIRRRSEEHTSELQSRGHLV